MKSTMQGEVGSGWSRFDATVRNDLMPSLRLYAEASCGPVAAVDRVGVFGRDVARVFAVSRRLEAGIGHINGAAVHDEPQIPFGGVKASGYDRLEGVAAMSDFIELRWITIAIKPGRYALLAG